MRILPPRNPPMVRMWKTIDFEETILGIEDAFEASLKKKMAEIKSRALRNGAANLGKDGETLKFDEPFASEMALARFEHSRTKNQLRERLIAIEAEFQIEMNKIEAEFTSRIKKRYADLLKGKQNDRS